MTDQNPEHDDLTRLGEGRTEPSRELETFPNRNPDRDYLVELHKRILLSLPQTGNPISHPHPLNPRSEDRRVQVPQTLLLELSGRGRLPRAFRQPPPRRPGRALSPRWCRVEVDFNPRGGWDGMAEHGLPGAGRMTMVREMSSPRRIQRKTLHSFRGMSILESKISPLRSWPPEGHGKLGIP